MTTMTEQACPTRVYRMRSSQRGVGIIFVTLGLLLWVAIWTQAFQGTREATLLDMVFPVLFTGICLAFTIRSHHADVRTSESVIELQTFLRRQILPIHAIRGRRTYVDRGDDESADVWHLVLESDDDRYPSLDIEDRYNFDEPFRAWFQSLPDLDLAEKSRARAVSYRLV